MSLKANLYYDRYGEEPIKKMSFQKVAISTTKPVEVLSLRPRLGI